MANGPERFWLIGGPYGVGKTTYAFKHVAAVSGSMNFVNSPQSRTDFRLSIQNSPSAAARIALSRAREFIARGIVFFDGDYHGGSNPPRPIEGGSDDGSFSRADVFFRAVRRICLERIRAGLPKAAATLGNRSSGVALRAAMKTSPPIAPPPISGGYTKRPAQSPASQQADPRHVTYLDECCVVAANPMVRDFLSTGFAAERS